MKKIYFILLCGLLCSANFNAQGLTQLNWDIGANSNPGGVGSVSAQLIFNDNTLTIMDAGTMMTWSDGNPAPWSEYPIYTYIWQGCNFDWIQSV